MRNWSKPTTDSEAWARAGGRRRYNAHRKFVANQRRRDLLEAFLRRWEAVPGLKRNLPRGFGKEMAVRFGVSQAQICRDLKQIFSQIQNQPVTREPFERWLEREFLGEE